MYNLCAVRSRIRIPHLLFALLMAAFVTFYPQLDAAGYCDGGGCPEVSFSAHGAGASFVVAALVVVPDVLRALLSRSALLTWGTRVLAGIDLPPEVPPPRSSA